jgi:hypothetical protein
VPGFTMFGAWAASRELAEYFGFSPRREASAESCDPLATHFLLRLRAEPHPRAARAPPRCFYSPPFFGASRLGLRAAGGSPFWPGGGLRWPFAAIARRRVACVLSAVLYVRPCGGPWRVPRARAAARRERLGVVPCIGRAGLCARMSDGAPLGAPSPLVLTCTH